MDAIQRQEVVIEASELQAIINNPNLRLFDATVLMNLAEGEPNAYEVYQAGHLPGAAFLDHSRISDPDAKYQLTIPTPEYLADALASLGISDDSEVVVYSSSMLLWATRIWWVLRYAGHTNVRVLNGGVEAWKAVGGDLAQDENVYGQGHFDISVQPDYFVNAEQMQSALQDDKVNAVHSLPQQVYDQAHIPSSVCQPFTDFVDNGTALLPDDILRERLIPSEGKTITYCGGGVAATVNAIVCRLVGNPDVSVYDGSMSEWVGEGLPVDSAS